MSILLVEMTGYNPGIPGTTVLRFCTGSSGYITGPNDDPPNTYYEPCVLQAGNVSQMMFADKTTSGVSRTGFGNARFANINGQLDYILNYGFDGLPYIVKIVEPTSIATISVCTMEQPVDDGEEITIRLRDRQAELDVPIQATKYLGNNVGADGLEGGDDLLGVEKPLLFGYRPNITPICVNTSKVIFQYHSSLATVQAAYDKGVITGGLTQGAAYTDQTDMMANAPTAGQYRVWSSAGGSYLRLASPPVGKLTIDATEGATATDRTQAQIARRMFLRAPTVTSYDLIEQSFIDLDKKNSAEVGIYITGSMTISDALSRILRPVSWSGFDNLGKFRVGRLELPAGTPICELTTNEETSVTRVVSEDIGRGVPACRVLLDYDENCTVQTDADLGGDKSSPTDSVGGLTRREWLAKQFRTVKSENLAVQTPHKLAPEMKFSSQFQLKSAAQAEADRLMGIYGVKNDIFEWQGPLDALKYPLGGWWDDGAVADMSAARYTHSVAVHNNWLYVIGGLLATNSPTASVTRLDLNNPTGAWDNVGVTGLPQARSSHASVVYNNYLYVIGGYTTGAIVSVIRLDLSNPTGAWDDIGVTDLPQARYNHAAVVFNNYLYVIGGTNTVPIASVIRLDLNNPAGVWDDVGVSDLPQARSQSVALMNGNYLYVIGGKNTEPYIIKLDLNNPTGSWSDIGAPFLLHSWRYHGAVIRGNYLYVIGGRGTLYPLATVTRLDLNNPTGGWDDAGVTDLPAGRQYSSAVVYKLNIFLIGGYTSTAQPNTYVYCTNQSLQDRSKLWDIGRVLTLRRPRLGYDAGKLMRILQNEPDYAAGTMKLTLWGGYE